MRRIVAILLGGLLLSSACATPPSQLGYEYWERPDASETDFAADRAECIYLSQAPMSVVSSRGNVMRMDVDDAAFLQCMRERDWQKHDSPIRPRGSDPAPPSR
jgi:hypothetical protein